MLKTYLNRSFETGYHSVATMYAEKEIEYGGSEDIAREFRSCIDEFKNSKLTAHEFTHLMFVATFMKEGNFEVYNNNVGEILDDLVEIGLYHDDCGVQEMAIQIVETFQSNTYIFGLLEKVKLYDKWLDDYRKQVLQDIKEN